MNCDDFRQQLIARPDELDDNMGAHMAACESCLGMATQVQAMDGVLRDALAVEVPQNLGQTVLMQKILQRKRRNVIPLFALAATLLLGIGVTAGLWLGRADTQIPAQLIAHIEHEPYLLLPSVDVVPIARVSSVLQQASVTLNDSIPSVRHIGMCEFRGHQVPHLVVHTQDGPITVMLLPHEKVRAVQPFDDGNYSGVIVPSGDGAIAVIGNQGADVEPVRRQFDRAIEFSI